jgi:hypothetical protein
MSGKYLFILLSVPPFRCHGHRRTEVRIARFRSLIAVSATRSQKLLPDYSWEDIKKICPAPVKAVKQ